MKNPAEHSCVLLSDWQLSDGSSPARLGKIVSMAFLTRSSARSGNNALKEKRKKVCKNY